MSIVDAPLSSRRIMITRPNNQSGDFEFLLREKGAETVSIPLISIVEPESWIPLDKSIQKIEEYDWLVFTSVNGVSFFEQRANFLGKKEDLLSSKCKILSIGPITSKAIDNCLKKKVYGYPEDYTSEGLIDFLKDIEIEGDSFLLPRAAVAREFLPEKLTSRGAKVDVVSAYQTKFVKLSRDSHFFDLLYGGKIDMVTFLSSSSVNAFVNCFTEEEIKEICKKADFACIGPITAATLTEHNLPLSVESDVSTSVGLTDKIVEFYHGN